MTKKRINWGPAPDERSVSLYCVRNTAHNSLYVFASDEEMAMSVACSANHIHDVTVIHADQYGRDVWRVTETMAGRFRDHWELIQRAAKKRVQGTVHLENGKLAIGQEVIEA